MPPNNDYTSQIGHAVQEIHPIESNNPTTDRGAHSSNNQQYDVLPPGVESPPPPGLENDPSLVPHKRHNRDTEWNVEHRSDKEVTAEQRPSRRQVSLRHMNTLHFSANFK